jgi:hypothetical protein
MHKLIIMIETPEDEMAFDAAWPEFLDTAERLPGLVQEATVRVDKILFGNAQINIIHELFFNSAAELDYAMNSPPGQLTGQVLQTLTGGRMLLMTAEHRQDDIENIRKYKPHVDTD